MPLKRGAGAGKAIYKSEALGETANAVRWRPERALNGFGEAESLKGAWPLSTFLAEREEP